MLERKLSILILMLILSGCQKKTSNIPTIVLPEVPLIPLKAVEEIKQVCVPRKSCDNFNNWLSDVYVFKIKYEIYKEELEKY
jgi:hypothetical protein